jgi:hypothetical protein
MLFVGTTVGVMVRVGVSTGVAVSVGVNVSVGVIVAVGTTSVSSGATTSQFLVTWHLEHWPRW